MWKKVVLGVVMIAFVAAAVFFVLGRRGGDTRDTARLVAGEYPEFVSRAVCTECHARETGQWLGSDHDFAMRAVDAGTVLGDFDNAEFAGDDGVTKFYRRDDRYYIETPGSNGTRDEHEIRYTFGVDPLQQYLVDTGRGRFQALTIAWDVDKKRWFDLHPEETVLQGHPFHWTAPAYNWNSRCAACHSTNLKKNLRVHPADSMLSAPDSPVSYETTWSEINVSCEACHGPGSRHVEWARKSEKMKEVDNLGFLVDMKEEASYEIEVCAPCHARRHSITDGYRHGDDFMDHYVPSLLRQDLYFPDGQIQEEVYVYGSFLQSKMYRQGVRCTDCHNPHSLSLKVEGNGLCVQCHQQRRNARFPDMPLGRYASPEHHHHGEGSEGALCVSCHMPARTYMVVDPRHDHSFRVPRPDLSTKLGTPNACNGCHEDKTNAWAANAIAEWFSTEAVRTPHYGEILAAGRAGDASALEGLRELSLDMDSPAIVRATAVGLLGRYPQPDVGFWGSVLRDESPLVRATSADGVAGFPTNDAESVSVRVTLLAPLLSDPVRAVRMRAARGLENLPDNLFEQTDVRARRAALAQFVAGETARADWPDAHLNLGVYYENRNNTRAAQQAYEMALRVDPNFDPVRFNLANLYNRLGQNDDAERVLRTLTEHEPENGEAHYSLGLLLAEMGRLEESIVHLGKATKMLTDRSRVSYNYGLALQSAGRLEEAEQALLAAHRAAPDDVGMLYALAVFYIRDESWDKALLYAQRLSALAPSDPAPVEMIRRIQLQTR